MVFKTLLRKTKQLDSRQTLLLKGCSVLLVSLIVFVLLRHLVESKIEQELTAQLSELGLVAVVGDVSIGLSGRFVTVSLVDLSVAEKLAESDLLIQDAAIEITGEWAKLLNGNLYFDAIAIKEVRVNLIVSEDGDLAWMNVYELILENMDPSSSSVVIGRVLVGSLDLEYIHEPLGQQGFLSAQGDVLTSDIPGVSSLTIRGDINYLPVSVSIDRKSVDGGETGDWQQEVSLNVSLSELVATAQLSLNSLLSPERGELALALEGKRVANMLNTLGLGMSQISRIDVASNIQFAPDKVEIESLEISLDESNLTGNLIWHSAGVEGKLAKITGKVDSRKLDLDGILGYVSADADDAVSSQAEIIDYSSGAVTASENMPFLKKLSEIEIDVSLGVNSLFRGSLIAHDAELILEKKGSTTKASLNVMELASGELSADLLMNITENSLSGRGYAQVKRAEISDIISAADLPDSLFTGLVSGDGKFWFEGSTPTELIASLDGGVFAIVEDGKLDSLLVEMAGIDFMESLSLVFKKDIQQTEVKCGYLDLQAEKGVISIADFIVDTEDSVFIASGEVDLVRKTLNVRFTPLPRDASFFAATTPVTVSGTLSSPVVRPGSKLYTRVAMAAAMATLAGPAAVVLPFIEFGNGEKTSQCTELFTK